MKIGIAQLNSNDNIPENFIQIKKIILEAQLEKPEVIFFPENSLFFRVDQGAQVQAVSLEDKIISDLKELCADTGIAIHFTTAVRDSAGVFNASVFIDKNRSAKIVYKKIHLFDIALTGQKPMRESDVFSHGPEPSIFNINEFKVGSSICYDIRFAELYSVYAKAGVDIILIPAAFLVKTGQAHWEVLLRARAIESQCYVIAAAQSGSHHSSVNEHIRETYGHSMIVSPWGEIMAVRAAGTGIIFAEIHQDLIQNIRKQIPMKSHRRIDF